MHALPARPVCGSETTSDVVVQLLCNGASDAVCQVPNWPEAPSHPHRFPQSNSFTLTSSSNEPPQAHFNNDHTRRINLVIKCPARGVIVSPVTLQRFKWISLGLQQFRIGAQKQTKPKVWILWILHIILLIMETLGPCSLYFSSQHIYLWGVNPLQQVHTSSSDAYAQRVCDINAHSQLAKHSALM